jgi:uncharacterized protein (TIGR02118 family)
MVKLTVLYPNRSGATFDEQYYLTRHVALVTELLAPYLKGAAVEKGIAALGTPAPYIMVGHMWFESIEAMQTAMEIHGPALRADIPNYTDLEPLFQVSEVVFSSEPHVARDAG